MVVVFSGPFHLNHIGFVPLQHLDGLGRLWIDDKNAGVTSLSYQPLPAPIYCGFILQIESASQRPSREFDVDSVRNHYCWPVFMLHSRLLTKCCYSELASAVRLCCEEYVFSKLKAALTSD